MNSAVVHTAYCGANGATAIFGTTPSIRPSNAQLDALQVLQNRCERETPLNTQHCALQCWPAQTSGPTILVHVPTTKLCICPLNY